MAKKKTAKTKKKPAPAKKKPAPAKKKPAPAKKKPAPAKKKLAPAKKKLAPAKKKLAPAKKKLAPAPAPDLVDLAPVAAPPSTESLYALVQRFALKMLLGGPVRVPVTRLAEVARLAWFADDHAEPELRVDAPVGARLPRLAAAETSRFEVSSAGPGESLRLGGAPADAGAWLGEVTPWLTSLPAGAVLELVAASRTALDDGVLLRCCGPVREGTWEIVSTYPPLSRDRLESALTLSLAGPSDRDEARARFRNELADVWPLA